MAILYRENVPYVVPDGLIRTRLSQGFTLAPVNVKPEPAITQESAEGKINVNTCTVAELVALQGIGVKTANEIVNGRPYEGLDWFAADPRTLPHFGRFAL